MGVGPPRDRPVFGQTHKRTPFTDEVPTRYDKDMLIVWQFSHLRIERRIMIQHGHSELKA